MLQFNNIYGCRLHKRQFAKVNDGLSGVAIGIYRYAATIFAIRQDILLTQLYFAFSKVLFLSLREVKANII